MWNIDLEKWGTLELEGEKSGEHQLKKVEFFFESYVYSVVLEPVTLNWRRKMIIRVGDSFRGLAKMVPGRETNDNSFSKRRKYFQLPLLF